MTDLWIFGYGSLLFAPELPDEVLEQRPARLDGWHRAFNKRSRARGCAEHEARWPAARVDAFTLTGHRWSLALGTGQGGHLDGGVIRYPAAIRDEVLARLHQREGWAPDRPRHHNGYLPRQIEAATPAGRVVATSWFSFPESRYHAALTLDDQARVLVHATPHVDDGRGLFYLEHTRAALATVSVVDPVLEDLWSAVLLHRPTVCS